MREPKRHAHLRQKSIAQISLLLSVIVLLFTGAKSTTGSDLHEYSDPLLQMNQSLQKILKTKKRVDSLTREQQCKLNFLQDLQWSFSQDEKNTLPAEPIHCKTGFSPSGTFRNDEALVALLDEILDSSATRCLYQLRVKSSMRKATQLMENNPQMVFDTENGHYTAVNGVITELTGHFLTCSGTTSNGTQPLVLDPSVPWGCILPDPCSAVEAFIGGLTSSDPKKPARIGMDCANAVQANQYVYTYFKFDLNQDQKMDERECRIFKQAYGDRKWEFAPLSIAQDKTLNPFVGKDVGGKEITSQALARKGDPYLSGIRGVMTLKDATYNELDGKLDAEKQELKSRIAQWEALEKEGSISKQQRKSLDEARRKLSEKNHKQNFLNENLLITALSPAAAREWAATEFTGKQDSPEAVGQFERDQLTIKTAFTEIRQSVGKKQFHIAEMILGDASMHYRLLDQKQFPRDENGKIDFSNLKSVLNEIVRTNTFSQPGYQITGTIQEALGSIKKILTILMQPRYREVRIYAHPTPARAEARNLASLVLRQMGAHTETNANPLTFRIYEETEQSVQFDRYKKAFIDDCVAHGDADEIH